MSGQADALAARTQVDQPRVSVVIPAVSSPTYLERTLAELTRQQAETGAEILVADRLGTATAELVSRKFPRVLVVPCPPSSSVPELRVAGIRASRASIVATLDDHCIPAPDWLRRIVAAHDGPYLAIGGLIENGATERLVDWAVFLCEYSRHFGPQPSGIADDLPGPNVSYKREALVHLDDLLCAGSWEMAWHDRLKEKGFPLFRDSAIVVHHRQLFSIREFAMQRFHYGRSFAGQRAERMPVGQRALLAMASVVLPPLLLGRIARAVFARRRHRGTLLKATPLLLVFLLSSTIGELLGCLAGPGESLQRVA
jgi:glycosyltransferase involved in cell wall biosynthesis